MLADILAAVTLWALASFVIGQLIGRAIDMMGGDGE